MIPQERPTSNAFMQFPPDREPLDQAYAMGMMTAQEYDAAVCQHHGTLCADCGRKIAPDSTSDGRLYVAVRTISNGETWFEHACRVELDWSTGGPVVVSADLHCTDMDSQVHFRPTAVDAELPLEAPLRP
jgi:hypothetical protein